MTLGHHFSAAVALPVCFGHRSCTSATSAPSRYQIQESTTLHGAENAVKLVGHISLKVRDDDCLVRFAIGRPGEKLQSCLATPVPVPLSRAKEIYEEWIDQKLTQGWKIECRTYRERCAHPPIFGGGLRPSRPLEIRRVQVPKLVTDPDWCLQEKLRGRHILVCKSPDGVHGRDENGDAVALPATVIQAAIGTRFRWVIEGIYDGTTFTAFDLPQFEMLGFRSLPYRVRMAAVRDLLRCAGPHLQVAETAEAFAAKVQMIQRLRGESKSGVVLKKLNGVSRRGDQIVEGYSLQCEFA